ncbi:CHAD domain-containing protein [Paenibacillus donghaensis]|uniref:CHAD domain-containing protein n=1 Tax=Paenibacillus donghaensis TaxID=414771 RepID=A0A2Z2KVW7_9BACL|nr:CHAD domain-containing protein [Paenibacillus donghaensis]ASA25491.1 hypothetical protein B9T62_35030 [Paenibacillus donghaensis]
MTTEQQTKDRQLSKTRQWEQALVILYANFRDYSKKALDKFDEEDIHQTRVNSRKLLTLLSILDPEHTSGLYPVFKKSQKRLGKVRDADVLIASFKDRRQAAKQEGSKKVAGLLKAVIKHQKDKRKIYRRKLAEQLPRLVNKELDRLWDTFLREQLEPLVSKRDANVVMRELEVAFEQQKKTCKTIFREQDSGSGEAFEALHQLRIAAKELRYTASSASFALSQKFHAHEQMFQEIQDQLGLINDKRVWLETLDSIGREKLEIGRKTWNAFTDALRAEVLEALQQNEVVPVATRTKS